MRSKILTLTTALMLVVSFQSKAQNNDLESSVGNNEHQTEFMRHSIGSSVFLLGNLDTEEPPQYFQLNYSYYLTPKDAIIAEAITWAYYHPLGKQYWDSSDDAYPGKARSFGVGFGYQRFHWKGLYSTIQATPFLQNYYDEADQKIQSGFMLWTQFRTGYRFEFAKKRWFIEPSVVINYWPVNTNLPDSFEQVEDNWPNYFLFEPGLHFGFKF